MLIELKQRIAHELAAYNTKAIRSNAARALAKHRAILAYKNMHKPRSMPVQDPVEVQLKHECESAHGSAPSELLDTLVETTTTPPSQRELARISNVAAFLESQRVYMELLERYNPGMRMDQGENVERSAQRVGLLVPPRL